MATGDKLVNLDELKLVYDKLHVPSVQVQIPTGQWSGSSTRTYTVNATNVTADTIIDWAMDSSINYLKTDLTVTPGSGTIQFSTTAIPAGTINVTLFFPGVNGEVVIQTLADVYSKSQVDQKIAQSTANGTWTPTVSGGTATGITVSQGRWYRQGNLVMLTCRWAATAANSGTYATISGNPFTSVNNPMGSTINQSTGKNGLAFGSGGAATFNLYFAPGQAETANGNAGYAYILFPIST